MGIPLGDESDLNGSLLDASTKIRLCGYLDVSNFAQSLRRHGRSFSEARLSLLADECQQRLTVSIKGPAIACLRR
jgi:hypothetical protein